MAYNVKLDIFEGPLALLLYLIKKNRVDIYDIPISTITEQYLEYLEVMRSMNLDVAGEFLLMASTLLHIKSKLLLPPQDSEEEPEEEDPREELVRKLIEYQRFKLAAEELIKRRLLGRDVFKRRNTSFLDGLKEEDQTIEIEDLSIMELISAFKEILKRLPEDTQGLEFTVDRFRVTDRINSILEVLSEERSVRFDELFIPTAPRGEIIVTFLAILELARLKMIRINQTTDGIIRLYRADREENRDGEEPETTH
ncbi:MAG TPA: hypothetical protein ENK42_01005 [Deltaproteobacteria bacterium]|nr:hypothetical protein [Deltaproteobacteria bacterium]